MQHRFAFNRSRGGGEGTRPSGCVALAQQDAAVSLCPSPFNSDPRAHNIKSLSMPSAYYPSVTYPPCARRHTRRRLCALQPHVQTQHCTCGTRDDAGRGRHGWSKTMNGHCRIGLCLCNRQSSRVEHWQIYTARDAMCRPYRDILLTADHRPRKDEKVHCSGGRHVCAYR